MLRDSKKATWYMRLGEKKRTISTPNYPSQTYMIYLSWLGNCIYAFVNVQSNSHRVVMRGLLKQGKHTSVGYPWFFQKVNISSITSGLAHLIQKIQQVANITTVNLTYLKADDPIYYFGLGVIYLALC